MKSTRFAVLAVSILVTLVACGPRRSRSGSAANLAQARQGFKTKLTKQLRDGKPADAPAGGELDVIRYPSPVGDLGAYISKPPSGNKKHPAIIWIFGGFDNGIGSTAWERAPLENDQSASVFRQAGIITLYPSLRGGNDNPGFREGFYGEVDDVIAAAKWLAQQPYVDPKRIYLGGHSTGGTLALLVAESTGGFRAVFSFGPVAEVRGYGPEELPFDFSDQKEAELRAPVYWLDGISRPTYVFEGARDGNIMDVRQLALATRNPNLHCYEIPGGDHFSILAEYTNLIAQNIMGDLGPDVKMTFPGAKSLSRQ